MRWLIGGLLVALLCVTAGAQAEKIVYVQGAQAPLYTSAQLGNSPITVVAQGTAMVVTAEAPRWYQVKVADHTGWVVKLMVADHPPVTSRTTPDTAMETLMERARVRPSTYSSTAAARGLRAEESAFQDAHQADYENVTQMQRFQPDAAAITDFIRSDLNDD